MAAAKWQDYSFNKDDWTGWTFKYLGYTRPTELPSTATRLSSSTASCDLSTAITTTTGTFWHTTTTTSYPLLEALAGLPSKTVVDATECGSSGLSFGGKTLTLSTDVTFLANDFDLDGAKVQSASSSGAHRFNLIQSDASVGNGSPNCPSGSDGSVRNFTMTTPISGLLYSPCQVDFGSSGTSNTASWYGQVFLKQLSDDFDSGSSTVSYVPITDLAGAANPNGFAGGTSTTTPSPTNVPTTVWTTTPVPTTIAPTMPPTPTLLSQVEQ
jgi:hypothetical protein